eukprot:scaffold2510_cov169-Amphora_coffeaeformis.AAC.43
MKLSTLSASHGRREKITNSMSLQGGRPKKVPRGVLYTIFLVGVGILLMQLDQMMSPKSSLPRSMYFSEQPLQSANDRNVMTDTNIAEQSKVEKVISDTIVTQAHVPPPPLSTAKPNVDTTTATTTLSNNGTVNLTNSKCKLAMKTLTPREQVLAAVKTYNTENGCDKDFSEAAASVDSATLGQQQPNCKFPNFGKALLLAAQNSTTSLLTVQAGGMDGKIK